MHQITIDTQSNDDKKSKAHTMQHIMTKAIKFHMYHKTSIKPQQMPIKYAMNQIVSDKIKVIQALM